MAKNRMEIIWGVRLLDEGFTSIPNLLMRNYRKLGVEHGEWGFICQLLTYKHDTRDPYPARDKLAEHLCCSPRQIDKWVKALREKGLLKTGRRRNVHDKRWDNAVYSLKPLLDACLKMVGEEALPPTPEEYEIVWDEENEPRVPEVRMGSVPEVRMGRVPEVRTKKKNKNNNEKLIDCMRATIEIAAASEPDPIYVTLNQYVPAYCYADNMPLAGGYINEIYLMLVNQFPTQLDSAVVKIACELYFERTCEIKAPHGVIMKLSLENPVGFFNTCYRDAIKQYKAQTGRKAAGR
jgi:hypothetical protein